MLERDNPESIRKHVLFLTFVLREDNKENPESGRKLSLVFLSSHECRHGLSNAMTRLWICPQTNPQLLDGVGEGDACPLNMQQQIEDFSVRHSVASTLVPCLVRLWCLSLQTF